MFYHFSLALRKRSNHRKSSFKGFLFLAGKFFTKLNFLTLNSLNFLIRYSPGTYGQHRDHLFTYLFRFSSSSKPAGMCSAKLTQSRPGSLLWLWLFIRGALDEPFHLRSLSLSSKQQLPRQGFCCPRKRLKLALTLLGKAL